MHNIIPINVLPKHFEEEKNCSIKITNYKKAQVFKLPLNVICQTLGHAIFIRKWLSDSNFQTHIVELYVLKRSLTF